jgi:hypothetical protein
MQNPNTIKAACQDCGAMFTINAMEVCEDCKGLFCWRHAKGKRDQHKCVGALFGKNQGTQEESKNKLKRSIDEANKLENSLIEPQLSKGCVAKLKGAHFTRAPFELFYASGSKIIFNASCYNTDDDDYTGEVFCTLKVDDLSVVKDQKGSVASWIFTAQDTINDRRKLCRVIFEVTDGFGKVISTEYQIRVAQTTKIGTPNLEPSNIYKEYKELLGNLLTEKGEERLVAIPNIETHQANAADMGTYVNPGIGFPRCIKYSQKAFEWNKEEFTALLKHELIHCEHFNFCLTKDGFWGKELSKQISNLNVKQVQNALVAASECEAYLSFFKDPAVSFKFLKEYFAVARIFTYYCEAMYQLKEAGVLANSVKGMETHLTFCIDEAKKIFPELNDIDRDSLAELKWAKKNAVLDFFPL